MMLDPDGWVYWFVCPELRRLETAAQRNQAVKRTKTAIMKGKWFSAQIAAFLIMALAGYKLMNWATSPGVVHMVLYTVGVTVAYIVVFTWIYGRKLRELVRHELNTQGIPVCIGCGYDISAQEVSRCPECGRDFDPGAASE